ncbi:hypothetical protein [Kitasatospora sp. NPDC086791]|uniref:hypothetical protein n=1 Tax=Kitasatospora sp. NPDC086791 TaxID=3155178 RepID=UPI003418DDA8
MTTQPTRIRNHTTLLGQTMALLAIQTEHPELADLGSVEWQVSTLGLLSCYVQAEDGEAVADAYQQVLGGVVEEPLPFARKDEPMEVRYLDTVWRDARVQIRVASPAPARLAVAS